MKIRQHYEKPDGWTKGQPEVLVADSVIDRLGMPVVDYDSLHQFLTDDIGIPSKARTVAKLYGKKGHDSSERLLAVGKYRPLSKSVRVNAVVGELHPYFQTSGGTMRILAHEARHRSNHMRHNGFNVPNLVTVAGASVIAGEYFGIVRQLPPQFKLIGAAGIVATAPALRKLSHPIIEAPALAEEVKQSTIDHETDILFPNSGRSWYLRDMGRPSVQNMEDMGWHEFDMRAAYDFVPQVDIPATVPSTEK